MNLEAAGTGLFLVSRAGRPLADIAAGWRTGERRMGAGKRHPANSLRKLGGWDDCIIAA